MHKVYGLASEARKVGAVGQDKIVGVVENALGDHDDRAEKEGELRETSYVWYTFRQPSSISCAALKVCGDIGNLHRRSPGWHEPEHERPSRRNRGHVERHCIRLSELAQ